MTARSTMITVLTVVAALLSPAPLARAVDGGTWSDTIASPSSFVTVVGDDGDFVTGGSDQLFRPGDGGKIRVYRNLGGLLEVDVLDPRGETHFELQFAPPPGEELVPGEYENAVRAPFLKPGRPGIDVDGNGNGCNDTEGRFTVLDAPSDLSRLWIIYHSSCESADGLGVSGEIRYNEPPGDSPLVVAPGRIDWTTYYPGSTSARVTPVSLINTGDSPIVLGPAEITSGATDFSLRQNDCRVIDPGQLCALAVAFSPSSAGLHTGVLSVPDPTHHDVRTTQLRGTGEFGHRTFDTVSQLGDAVGLGQSYSYSGRDSGTTLHGDSTRFEVDVSGQNGDWWEMGATAPTGRPFEAGTTYDLGPANQPGDTSYATFAASIRPRGCWVVRGRLTIDQIVLDDRGLISALAFSFQQYCDGSLAGLAGSYAAGTARAAPPVPDLPPAPPPDPAPPQSGPDESSLSFVNAFPVTMYYGSTRRLDGAARYRGTAAGIAGADVTIQSQSGSLPWRTVGVVTTDSDGRFHWTTRNTVRTFYRALLPATSRYGAVTSIEVSGDVVPLMSISAHAHRHRFSIAVAIHPTAPGHRVELERYRAHRWHTVRILALPRSGTWSFHVGRSKGTLYRVISLPNTRYAGRTSRPIRVR